MNYTDIFSQFDLEKIKDNVHTDIEKARGLPNEFYTSDQYLQLEKEKVFSPNWVCVASIADVPSPGSAIPVDFLGVPLLVLRNKDGEIKTFHNVCLHRGMTLVEKPKKFSGALTCPYHAWCYNLDGKLIKTPKAGGPDSDKSCLPDIDFMNLKSVRTHVWMGCIFVNLNEQADDFEKINAPLMERWHEYSNAPLIHAGEDNHFSLDLNCNWKLGVENYCESYHLPWVHPGLNSYSRLEDHYHIESDCYSGQGTTVYNPNFGEGCLPFPNHLGMNGKGLDKKWDLSAEYVSLYPNLLLGVHRDHFYSIRIEPVTANSCREVVDIFYYDEKTLGDEYKSTRIKNKEMWRSVFLEDVFAVEGMQKGRYSPVFDGGRFTPAMDGPTHCFHKWIASAVARQGRD